MALNKRELAIALIANGIAAMISYYPEDHDSESLRGVLTPAYTSSIRLAVTSAFNVIRFWNCL